MFRTIADFKEDWTFEMASTIKIMKNLTDASLMQQVTPEGRSLGFLAWHIIGSIRQMLGRAGLTHPGAPENTDVAASAETLVAAYEQAAKSVLEQVTSQWTDEQLPEEIPMFREPWRRGFILTILIRHQAHHRAQMTVLMRQAGLMVPGVYGPSKEEWQKMNLPSLK
jgi:uncharacterized damage-inducible protein DinB